MTVPSEPPVPRRSRRRLWLSLAAVAFVVLLVWAYVMGPLAPHIFSGTVIQSSDPAPSMDLLAYADGTPVDLEQLRGDVVLIYFGYTHCPDLCPAMLSTVADSLELLGDKADRVTTLMVTVDPARDGPDYLQEYVEYFNPEFRAVWGPEESVRSVASAFGVAFEYDAPNADGSYLIAHTASMLAIDTEGVVRVKFAVGTTPEELAPDIEELLS